jgi:hypothetical protein
MNCDLAIETMAGQRQHARLGSVHASETIAAAVESSAKSAPKTFRAARPPLYVRGSPPWRCRR